MKKILCAAVAAVLAVGALTACGNKPSEPSGADAGKNSQQNVTTAEPASSPFVPEEVPSQFKANGSNITEKEGGGVSVSVAPREGDERYNFENDDLGFVDTESGALLKIGMSSEDVEKLIGAPRTVDRDGFRIYSGIVIKYDDNGNASQMIVAAGNMEGDDNPNRFVSPRGVKLSTTLDEFKSVYGDEYNEPSQAAEGDESIKSSAMMAVRYYAKNGDTFNYLGGSYTKENKPENDADFIMQTFLFSTETKTVSVMSVGNGTAN